MFWTSSWLRMLLENCRMRIVKRTAVAGRPATEIFLQPKGAGGSRTLWIDNDTGVILHSEERNSEGELVTATVYRSIVYGKTAPPDRFFPIAPSGPPVRWRPEDDFAFKADQPEEIHRAIGLPLREPAYIPEGFVREGYYLYKCPGCSLKTAVTRYVNGLDSLTVIQAPEGCGAHLDKSPMDFGMGKALYARHGTSNFWVLGELPDGDLKRVRDSLGSP